MPAADLGAEHVDDGVALLELPADELVRLEDGDDAIHARHGLQRELRDLLAVADHPDDDDPFAGRDVSAGPDLLDARDHMGDLRFGRRLVHDDHHAQLGLPSPSPCAPTPEEVRLRRKSSISS